MRLAVTWIEIDYAELEVFKCALISIEWVVFIAHEWCNRIMEIGNVRDKVCSQQADEQSEKRNKKLNDK